MSSSTVLPTTPFQRRYQRMPRLMFWLRRIQGTNFEPEMKLLDVLCDRGATSVDVGAKLGMYTHRLLKHSRDVVAFEPIPVLGAMLESVFKKKPVRIERCALSDKPGSTKMRVPYGSNGEVIFGRSTIEPTNSLHHGDVARVEEIEVPLRTLDELDLRGVRFIKIDVEGHELAVLRGAAQTIAREQPTLLVEANDHHHPGAVRELRELMIAHGYQGFFIEGGALVGLATITDFEQLQARHVENFLFFPLSHPDRLASLERRLKKA